MAFGDPANSGANHLNKDAGTVATSTFTVTFATTAGNTLIVGVRKGSAGTLGTVTVAISENSGSTFTNATVCGAGQTVTSSGSLWLFYFPNIKGAASSATQVKVTFDTSQTMRFEVAEYVGNFLYDTQTFANGGASTSTSFNSGSLTTTAIRTLIGFAIFGRNGVNTAPATPGSTNSLTWTKRDELDTSGDVSCILFDFNAGRQAAGTYNMLGTIAVADNWGAVIASFADNSAVFTFQQLIPEHQEYPSEHRQLTEVVGY